MVRVFLGLALAATGIVLALSVTVVVMALQPEPGANMVLMVMPCLAMPTGCAAGVSLLIAAAHPTKLRPWERSLAWLGGGGALILFAVLAVLG